MKLVGAHAFFARTKQVERHEPLVQGNVAVLEYGPDGHAELLTAGPTVKQAGSRVAPWHLPRRFRRVASSSDAAVRANGAVRPTLGFKVFSRFIRVLKVRFEKCRFHTTIMRRVVLICQVYNPEDFAGFCAQFVVHSGLDVLAGIQILNCSPSGWTRRLANSADLIESVESQHRRLIPR